MAYVSTASFVLFPCVDPSICHSCVLEDTLHPHVYSVLILGSTLRENSTFNFIVTKRIQCRRSFSNRSYVRTECPTPISSQQPLILHTRLARAIAPTLHVTSSRHLVKGW
jgi:hypothetical protein